MFYAKSTGGFYDSEIHGNSIPADAVEITKEEHAELLNGQSNGFEIVADENGRPILAPRASGAAKAPQQVSRAQGKAALIKSGLWQGVLDYVASIEDATEKALAEVALNDTTHWQRTSPFLNDAAEALGLTQAQLDELFVTASEIEL